MKESSSLLSGAALREFARSSEGKDLLRRHCEHHDVHVLTGGDQASLQRSDLEVLEETPLGYEDCEHTRLVYTDRCILIRNEISCINCSVTLVDCFTEDDDAPVQFMVLNETDQEVETEETMEVLNGRTKELRLRCVFPETFKGVVSRWILLKIRKMNQANALEEVKSEWICGVFITFLVKAEAMPLSIDAKPFIPQLMRELFDRPVALT